MENRLKVIEWRITLGFQKPSLHGVASLLRLCLGLVRIVKAAAMYRYLLQE